MVLDLPVKWEVFPVPFAQHTVIHWRSGVWQGSPSSKGHLGSGKMTHQSYNQIENTTRFDKRWSNTKQPTHTDKAILGWQGAIQKNASVCSFQFWPPKPTYVDPREEPVVVRVSVSKNRAPELFLWAPGFIFSRRWSASPGFTWPMSWFGAKLLAAGLRFLLSDQSHVQT